MDQPDSPPLVQTAYPFDVERLIALCRRNDVAMLGLFGSMARCEQRAESDIDLLVRFAKPKSLIAMIALEQELSDALGRPVDLVTEAGLSPHLCEHVLRDLRVLYDAG